MLCWGVLTGCLSSRPTSQGVVRIETGCPRVPASRHCDHERRLPPSPTALPLFYGSRSAGVGPGLVDAPIHILCVASVCARAVWCVVCVWMGIARVCSSRPVPTREGPVCRAPAPARVHTSQPHRLFREQTLDLPMCWWPTRLAACSLPHPPHSPPRSLAPLVGVCLVPCVTCACGATTSGLVCYRMAVGGVRGGEAFGAPHVSFLMVPATPRRIDARGSDSL